LLTLQKQNIKLLLKASTFSEGNLTLKGIFARGFEATVQKYLYSGSVSSFE
jgi:hypothetical protein